MFPRAEYALPMLFYEKDRLLTCFRGYEYP